MYTLQQYFYIQCFSTHGNTNTQGFVCGNAFYVFCYPMKSEREAGQGLKKFAHQVGMPAQVHTDNAKVETLSEWSADSITGSNTVTEAYTANQNKREH